MRAGVGGVPAVVAHHPQLARGEGHGTEGLLVVLVEVGLVQRLAVDDDPALVVAALHGLPADRDHPLDEVPVAGRRDAHGRPRNNAARPNQFVGLLACASEGQVSGPSKTTTSPGCGSANQ